MIYMNKCEFLMSGEARRKVLSPGEETGRAKKLTKLSTACVGKKPGLVREAQQGPISPWVGVWRNGAPLCRASRAGGSLPSPAWARS